MTPFEALSVPAQANRIRRLARDVLPRFGLKTSTPFRLLHHGENTTFRIEAPRGRLYNLRVHRAGHQSDHEIESELHWIRALDRDTDLVVPAPIEGVDGRLLQHGAASGVPERRAVTLLTWVDGRFLTRQASAAGHRRIGVLAAHLHEHGLAWQRPKRFRRRIWDADGLLTERAHFGAPLSAPGITPATRALFERTLARLHADLEALGQRDGEFGLIHADLHLWNLVVKDGVAQPIDFDDCGIGWLGYDFAVMLTPSLAHPRAEHAKAAWRDGYESVRPFPEAQWEAFDLMAATRCMAMLGWAAQRSDNARIRTSLPVRMAISRARCKAYLADRPQTSVRW